MPAIKRYTLQASSCDIFYFNENDGKGYEGKAHVPTIDRFTVIYQGKEELLDEFKKNVENNGVILRHSGLFSFPMETIELLHKQGGIVKEEPMYSNYREITHIPLKSLTECDIESDEFIEFYRRFKYYAKNDREFYRLIMNDEYYPQAFKELINKNLTDSFNNMRLKKMIGGYTLMRKAYKDMINYR